MPLPIFPTSPVPAPMGRTPFWNTAKQTFDSGAHAASSPYAKPLYRYEFELVNFPRTKQRSLEIFVNSCKMGGTFLFMDPYDNRISGIICVRTGTATRSFMVQTEEGHKYIPVSGSLLITSALSGALTAGTHYTWNTDTGVFSTSLAPSSADYWVASCAYYRKCALDDYSITSEVWDSFNGSISFHEVALP